MKNILVTGGAGFIGSHLIDVLLKDKQNRITCLDDFDSFYDPQVKKNNIRNQLKNPNYKLIEIDVRYINELKTKLSSHYDVIIHLAAKVGVIPSLQDPVTYTQVNILGTQNMLELTRELQCKKFVFASSSSVYGVNPNIPWNEDDHVLRPISPYACTKISGELLGHVYSQLYDFQFIGLRFFAVYGPRQRPDLAVYKFTRLILDDKPIPVYGNGRTKRDYTYIDDIVSGICAALDYSQSQYEIINLGNNQPVELQELISLLEKALGKKAIVKKLPEQKGDVPVTFANITKAQKLFGYGPKTDLKEGLQKFISWFRSQENNGV